MNHAARQHHRAQRRVGAAVHDHVDVHRGEAAVARQAGAMPHDRRMPLGRRQQILDAVVDHLHRPAGLAREDRRVARQHRRVFFLAAKPAAGFGLDDADAIGRQLQQHHQRLVHVVRALQRSVDRHLRRRRAPRSRRWFRCRAAPDDRCDIRLRSRRSAFRNPRSMSPLSIAIFLKQTSDVSGS